MAIDSQIQDRVNAYRGNPQALQQRYAQSQELMDLLAMQKMKSEKEAYARDMQLKADNQPKTIAQQYESDLVAKTKDEMLKGVQGVMANEQNKKQKNINKVAEVGVAPVGNTNPAIANTGVAAAPQGGMMKLAGGGIVGFAGPTGSVVEGEDYKKVLEQQELLRFANITPEQWESLSDTAKQEFTELYAKSKGESQLKQDFLGKGKQTDILRREIAGIASENPIGVDTIKPGIDYMLGNKGDYAQSLKDKEAYGKKIQNIKDMRYQDKVEIGSRGPDSEKFGDDFVGKDLNMPSVQPEVVEKKVDTVVPEEKPKPIIPNGGIASNQITAAEPYQNLINLQPRANVLYEAPNRETDMKKKVASGIGTLIDTDANAIKNSLDVDPNQQAAIDKLAADRKGITANLLDPERLRKDRLSAGLLAPGSATLGGTLGNMGRGIMGAQAAQDKTTISEFDQNKKIFDQELARSQGIKKEAVKERGLNIRQGIASGTLFSNQEQQNLNEDAKNILQSKNINARSNDASDARKITYALALTEGKNKVAIANQLATSTAETNKLKLELNKITKDSASFVQLQTRLSEVNKGIQRAAEIASKSDKDALFFANQRLDTAKQNKGPDSDEYKNALSTVNDLKGRQKALYDVMVADYLEQRKMILAKMDGTGSGFKKGSLKTL